MHPVARIVRCVVVTNVPAPYRLPMWELVARSGRVDLHIIYCAPAHIDPEKSGHSSSYTTYFLNGRYSARESGFSHSDFGIWNLLNSIRPDIVVTTGYITTFLIAFLWTVLHHKKHVAMTDGTLVSERSFSWKHRWVRRVVFHFTSAFLGASNGSTDLFLSYGIERQRIFKAALCVDNEKFSTSPRSRSIDLLFVGRFIDIKNPTFAIDVACEVARRLDRIVSIRFIGSGPLEAAIRSKSEVNTDLVSVSFAGYLSGSELPEEYARVKIFLFPSSNDTWGVVGNEACAAGLPCIVSPFAGVSGELIVDGLNGFIRSLDLSQWADSCFRLLNDSSLWESMSEAARIQVRNFTFESSADGFLDAIDHAVRTNDSSVLA